MSAELDAARALAEGALAELRQAGVVVVPNPLDLTCGQLQALAGCWGLLGRWDVARVDGSRTVGEVLDRLAFDGGEAPMKDAATALGWLELVGLVRTPGGGAP